MAVDKEDGGNGKQLYQAIGELRYGVKYMVKSQDELKDTVKDLTKVVTETAATAVTQKECTNRTGHLQESIGGLLVDLGKKQTRQDHPAIGSSTGQASAYNPDSLTPLPPQEAKAFTEKLRENIGLVTASLGLMALLGAGAVKAAYFIVDLDSALAKSERRQESHAKNLRKEIKAMKVLAEMPKVIPVPIPVAPDAGPTHSRRHRRRPAR